MERCFKIATFRLTKAGMISHREEVTDVQSTLRQNSALTTRTDRLLNFALETLGDL